MPDRAPRACGFHGCPLLRPCVKHGVHPRRDLRDALKKHESVVLYRGARWDRLRLAQLNKAPLCEKCQKTSHVIPATVVDHIKPHRGDTALFFDAGNLQSLCKPCHDRKTADEVFGHKRPA